MTVTYTPDLARDAVFELINGETFAGRVVSAYYQLPVDYTEVGTEEASVLIYTTGGSGRFLDRVDRLTTKTYAQGTDAVAVAEAIRAALVPGPHDLDSGFIDGIHTEVTPYDSPYPSTVNEAYTSYLVTYRPQEAWPVGTPDA